MKKPEHLINRLSDDSEPLRTLRLGLAQGHVPTDPDALTPEVARRIAALGVRRITTHFEVPPGSLAGHRGEAIATTLADSGIRIAQCAGVRPDLVTTDPLRREAAVAALAELMTSARSLNAEMIVFGCGSLHPTFPYGSARENHLPETRERLVSSLRAVARRAEEAGMPAAVECHVLTTLDTPEHVREIVDAVDSEWLMVNFDPVNFLGSAEHVYDSGARTRHAAAVLAPRFAPSAHIKDAIIQPDLVVNIAEAPAGQGVVDLDAIVDSCARHLPDGASIIIEHFGPEESELALEHVTGIAARLGVTLAR